MLVILFHQVFCQDIIFLTTLIKDHVIMDMFPYSQKHIAGQCSWSGSPCEDIHVSIFKFFSQIFEMRKDILYSVENIKMFHKFVIIRDDSIFYLDGKSESIGIFYNLSILHSFMFFSLLDLRSSLNLNFEIVRK